MRNGFIAMSLKIGQPSWESLAVVPEHDMTVPGTRKAMWVGEECSDSYKTKGDN